jgi:hypothetical protein
MPNEVWRALRRLACLAPSASSSVVKVPRGSSAAQIRYGSGPSQVPPGVSHREHQLIGLTGLDVAIGNGDLHQVDGLTRGNSPEPRVPQGLSIVGDPPGAIRQTVADRSEISRL